MLPWRCSTAAASSARSSGTIRLRMHGRRWRRWGRRGLLPPWWCSRASCTLLAGKTMRRRRTEISASSDAVGPLLLPVRCFAPQSNPPPPPATTQLRCHLNPREAGLSRQPAAGLRQRQGTHTAAPTCWLRPLPALVSPRLGRGESSCRDRRHWGRGPLFLLCGWEKETGGQYLPALSSRRYTTPRPLHHAAHPISHTRALSATGRHVARTRGGNAQGSPQSREGGRGAISQ